MSFHGRTHDTLRPVIYQLMVRTFGNTCETSQPNGSITQNGCGKFADITPVALASLKRMGFTHLWLTGVLEQSSCTAYPNRPADDPAVVKGLAGSPYAIKDYFDVCPDYALVPDQRMDEFKSLLARCKSSGFRVLIDFVPNHVARSYASDVRPDLSFGHDDDPSEFFVRDNHFFYLNDQHPGGGPPLKLPSPADLDGVTLYAPESRIGRVSGNNVVSWQPSKHDWFETAKLNYGHDFTTGRNTSHLPGPKAHDAEVPKTWRTMDAILAYWQAVGVDGFRADMAHMVPMEFWRWAIHRCHDRNAQVFFVAEAYDNDPAKLTDGQVLDALIDAGFNAVYDATCYDIIQGIYQAGKWANDLDPLTFSGKRFHQSLRYAENHDEVRLANPNHWGGLGMKVGKPVSAVLFAMGCGPVMLYNGQEVGEPAVSSHDGGTHARTSILDYLSMPEFAKWVNGHAFDGDRLSNEQKSLRDWYGKLIGVTQARAFTSGHFYGLNHDNKENPAFGRVGDETCSGHWLYAFLRRDSKSGQAFLVLVNFHGSETLRNVRIRIPSDAQCFLGRTGDDSWTFSDRLDSHWSCSVVRNLLDHQGVTLPDIEPCSAMLLEIGR